MEKRGMPAGALLVAGILISITAFSVLNFTQTENASAMQLFLYIGLLFIVIASIKYFLKSKKTIIKGEQDFASRLAQPQRQEKQEVKVITCQVCNTRNYSTSNYCHMCGVKLR